MVKGEIICVTEYVKVLKTGKTEDGKPAIWVKNLETGKEIGIEQDIATEYSSADKFAKTEKVSLTRIIEILESAGDKVFTVNFNKKPKEDEIAKAIAALPVGDLQNKKKIVECFKGEERTLRGRMVAAEPKLGRSTVIDLDLEKIIKGEFDSRLRQVDHRTINWLIFADTKYVVK